MLVEFPEAGWHSGHQSTCRPTSDHGESPIMRKRIVPLKQYFRSIINEYAQSMLTSAISLCQRVDNTVSDLWLINLKEEKKVRKVRTVMSV